MNYEVYPTTRKGEIEVFMEESIGILLVRVELTKDWCRVETIMGDIVSTTFDEFNARDICYSLYDELEILGVV